MKLPKTPGQFLDFVLKGERAWMVDIRQDGTPEFWLRTDEGKYATVTYEQDALWVNLYCDRRILYEFEFSRFREDWPRWSWSRQIGEKSWGKSEHHDLLRHLEQECGL